MKNRRKLTMLTLVAALAAAVYLNWQYAQSDFTVDSTNVNAAVTEPVMQSEAIITEQLPDKNYGDAQLVSTAQADSDKYFEQARLTRSQTRDEALDKLQKALKSAQLTQEEKAALTQSLSKTVDSIATESEIENIIIAKGFTDCVVFINGDKVNVAVKPGGTGLDSAKTAQIRDAVLAKADTAAKNITVVEVK